jgi:hypothetical protein
MESRAWNGRVPNEARKKAMCRCDGSMDGLVYRTRLTSALLVSEYVGLGESELMSADRFVLLGRFIMPLRGAEATPRDRHPSLKNTISSLLYPPQACFRLSQARHAGRLPSATRLSESKRARCSRVGRTAARLTRHASETALGTRNRR